MFTFNNLITVCWNRSCIMPSGSYSSLCLHRAYARKRMPLPIPRRLYISMSSNVYYKRRRNDCTTPRTGMHWSTMSAWPGSVWPAPRTGRAIHTMQFGDNASSCSPAPAMQPLSMAGCGWGKYDWRHWSAICGNGPKTTRMFFPVLTHCSVRSTVVPAYKANREKLDYV